MTPLYQHPDLPYQKHSFRNTVVQLADLEKHVYFTVLMLSMEFFSRQFYLLRLSSCAPSVKPMVGFQKDTSLFVSVMRNSFGVGNVVEPTGQRIMNFCKQLKNIAFNDTNNPGLLSSQPIISHLNEAAAKMGDKKRKASPPIAIPRAAPGL